MDHELLRNLALKCARLSKEFDVEERIGSGGFGDVYKVKNKNDDTQYAMKIVTFDSHTEVAGKYKREAQVFAKLNHPNIVRYHASWIDTVQIPVNQYNEMLKSSNFTGEFSGLTEIDRCEENLNLSDEEDFSDFSEDNEDADDDDFSNYDEDTDDADNNDLDSIVSFRDSSKESTMEEVKEVKFLFIQMELCEDRTLRTAINDNLYLDEIKLDKYFKEICEGLSHIHMHGIIHRDLKPENIFISSSDVIKIGDFNLSRQLSTDTNEDIQKESLASLSLSDCGTPIYVAPEVYDQQKYSSKADMYSLGVIYIEMCSRKMTDMEKAEIIARQRSISCDFKEKTNLIKRLLDLNSNNRPSCDNILTTLYSKKSMDDLKEIMQQHQVASYPQIKQYYTTLKTYHNRYADFFLKIAAEIFELHDARSLPMPTFYPSNNDYKNSVSLLNSHGNTFSLQNNSRLAFCHYLRLNNIQKCRRYALGRCYEDNTFLPVENQECIFESVRPGTSYINDSESLYIVQEIIDKVFRHVQDKTLMFYLNHELLLDAVLQKFQMTPNVEAALKSILVNITDITCKQELRRKLSIPLLKPDVVEQLLMFCEPINISAEQPFPVHYKKFLFKLLTVAKLAGNFGVDVNNIFLAPLLMTEKDNKGMMFQVVMKLKVPNKSVVVASGERFDHLVMKHKKKGGKGRASSAVGVTFKIRNIIHVLEKNQPEMKNRICFAVMTEDKKLAIPFMKRMWSQGLKCEIVKRRKEAITINEFKEYNKIIDIRYKNKVMLLLLSSDG